MQVKDKGHGARNSIVILNRWGSVSTFKLQENRKGLRFRLVIWCEESILPNPLPLSQGHLPSLPLEILIPRAKRNKLAFGPRISGRKRAGDAIFAYFHYRSLPFPLKTTERLCVRMYVFFIYSYACIHIINAILVATESLLRKCSFYM